MDILKFKRDQYDANNNNNIYISKYVKRKANNIDSTKNLTDSHLFLYFHKNRISIKPDIR